MANFISIDYFKSGQLAINNLNSTGFVTTAIENDVKDYIARYEPEYFKKLLGDTLYAYMVAHPLEVRVVALLAKLRDDTAKTSPCANYIYYHYQADKQIVQTESGDKNVNAGGSESMANIRRYVNIWNSMVDASYEFDEWLQENRTTYPEYCPDAESIDLWETINILDI